MRRTPCRPSPRTQHNSSRRAASVSSRATEESREILRMNMADLVRDAAGFYPGKDALLDGRDRYTFEELERLSSNFAAFLISRGVQKGDRIVFCSPKTAPLIVAILGCMKTGAIYVPVDRKLPKDRLSFILQDVSPRF